jgi:hypothetical protein
MTSTKSSTKSKAPPSAARMTPSARPMKPCAGWIPRPLKRVQWPPGSKTQRAAHTAWERALDRTSDRAAAVVNAPARTLEEMLLKIHVAGFIIDPVKRGTFVPAFKVGGPDWQPRDFAPCDDMALIVSLRTDLNRFLQVMACQPADVELIALGAKFEPLLLPYVAAHVEWSKKVVAANAATEKKFTKVYDVVSPYSKALSAELKRRGVRAAETVLSRHHGKMEKLAEKIMAAPASSPAGLRAKALVALWECVPIEASGTAFSYDRERTLRDLMPAAARVTGLGDLFASIRAQLKKS